jgi:hypothetical protein
LCWPYSDTAFPCPWGFVAVTWHIISAYEIWPCCPDVSLYNTVAIFRVSDAGKCRPTALSGFFFPKGSATDLPYKRTFKLLNNTFTGCTWVTVSVYCNKDDITFKYNFNFSYYFIIPLFQFWFSPKNPRGEVMSAFPPAGAHGVTWSTGLEHGVIQWEESLLSIGQHHATYAQLLALQSLYVYWAASFILKMTIAMYAETEWFWQICSIKAQLI